MKECVKFFPDQIFFHTSNLGGGGGGRKPNTHFVSKLMFFSAIWDCGDSLKILNLALKIWKCGESLDYILGKYYSRSFCNLFKIWQTSSAKAGQGYQALLPGLRPTEAKTWTNMRCRTSEGTSASQVQQGSWWCGCRSLGEIWDRRAPETCHVTVESHVFQCLLFWLVCCVVSHLVGRVSAPPRLVADKRSATHQALVCLARFVFFLTFFEVWVMSFLPFLCFLLFVLHLFLSRNCINVVFRPLCGRR